MIRESFSIQRVDMPSHISIPYHPLPRSPLAKISFGGFAMAWRFFMQFLGDIIPALKDLIIWVSFQYQRQCNELSVI